MSITNNKSLVVLVALNVISFMVIFWLIGMLMGKQGSEPVQTSESGQSSMPAPIARAPAAPEPMSAVAQTPREVEPPEPVTRVAPAAVNMPTLAETIEQELGKPVPAEPERKDPVDVASTVDVYYDGNIVRVEETDEFGNVNVSISNSLHEVKKLAARDAEYVAALQELKNGARSHMSMEKITQVDPKKYRARETKKAARVDHFNKVEVDSRTARIDNSALAALAEQIETVVAENAAAGTAAKDRKYARASVQDYLKSLDVASKERSNETRIIRVRPGDSLWKIAARAYGDGFQYARIFKANPHLTSPDLIRVGDILRVPL